MCGLCLDVCVLDTCVNAAACGFRDATYMVLDACRAAHVHGLGTFGSGFLYEPALVRSKMEGAALRLASVAAVVGEPKTPPPPPAAAATASGRWAAAASTAALVGGLGKAKPKAFPEALASFGLEAASCAVLVSDGTYHLARRVDATLQDPTLRAVGHLFAETGSTSPGCPLPPGWPGAPASAATLCWANPLPKAAAPDPSEFGCLMAASTSPELNFVAYGGFLLLDRRGAVVAVQSLCVPKAGGAVLRFDPPRRWRPEFIGGVEPRLQAITLPALLRAGATSFCWVHPREIIASGPEEWAPSVTGAFLYQLADGTAVYFPLVSSSGASLGPLPAVPGGRWVAAAAATAALLALVAARRAR